MTQKITIILILLCFVKGFSQDSNQEISEFQPHWNFRVGINMVDNRGDEVFLGGLAHPEQNALGMVPLTVGLEKRIGKLFGIEGVASVNSWAGDEGFIDGLFLRENEGYVSLDINGKLYIDEIFTLTSKLKWLDIYANAGMGYFEINERKIALNYGFGSSIWFFERFGIDLNVVKKIPLNSAEVFDTNHFVYSLGFVVRLSHKSHQKESISKESTGSSQDSDLDAIPDYIDVCPNVAGPVENKGCPYADGDNDGVIDKSDDCPQIKGSPTNKGCPLPKKQEVLMEKSEKKEPVTSSENLVSIAKKIKFEPGNYNFTQDTYPYLVKLAEMLTQEPKSARFKIVGHTDSSGSYQTNRDLSLKRASAVRNYLVDSGIARNRIAIQGLGESNPIDSNLTKEGRANNRRVEITILK